MSERNRTIRLTDADIPECDALIKPTLPDSPSDTIINGDTLELLPSIPDSTFDLIVVDPPYNITKRFGAVGFTRVSDTEYETYLRSWLPALSDKLKPNGTLYMCGDWSSSHTMHRVLSDSLTVINRITWQREKGRGSERNWKNSMEDIWFAVKDPKNYKFNVDCVKMKRRVIAPYRDNGKAKDWYEDGDGKFRMTYPSNFWDDITVPFWSMKENTDHPTQKPEKLIAKLILASSDEGDLVFDPFMGSGTVCVTAKKLNRHYCGIEIDRNYCRIAAKRIIMADTDSTIQGYDGKVFLSRNI